MPLANPRMVDYPEAIRLPRRD